MCFSASVSFGAAAVLTPMGLYALQQARRLDAPYWVLALAPLFFAIQQGLEGRVWQMLDAGYESGAIPYALGFHFFSHFLWLWWIPLSSFLVEQGKIRKRVFLGITLFGALAGAMVFFVLLLNPDWLTVEVRHHSIVYDITSPYRGFFSIGVPPSVLYGLIILVPLLFSSHRYMNIFGGLVAISIILATLAYGYAFVSVWCFFAAVLSLYLVYMIRRLAVLTGEKRLIESV